MIDIRGIPKINMDAYMDHVRAIELFTRRLTRKKELSRRQLSHGNIKEFGETVSEINLLEDFISQLKREVHLA